MTRYSSRVYSAVRASLAAAAGATMVACSDSTAPRDTTADVQFGQVLSLSQLQSALAGSARVEIELLPGGLIAREVEVENEDGDEQIESRVTAINPVAGTITLELGGMVVSYTSDTRFRTTTNSDASRSAWESAVTASLNTGGRPAIEVRRDRPATPQAPTAATFVATELRLESEFDAPKLEVYVDADNLAFVSSPPGAIAILRVFNIPITITTSTRLQRVAPDGIIPTGNVQFEARVTSVNVGQGTITIAGGTVIQASAVALDPTGDLFTLTTVAAAVNAGRPVRVEGRGTVQSAGPPVVILATDLKVEVDD